MTFSLYKVGAVLSSQTTLTQSSKTHLSPYTRCLLLIFSCCNLFIAYLNRIT